MAKHAPNIIDRLFDGPEGTRKLIVRLIFLLVLLALCLITYHGMTDNYLFNDDFLWLRQARNDMEPANLLTHRVIGFFRPLVNVSFYLMEQTSPHNIPFHYSFNLILHFLNTLLVYQLIYVLLRDRSVASATAVLFAVTSVHTGAVLWISARTTLLSTFFLLASLALMASRQGAKRFEWVGPAVLYILALASKETAIAGFPLVLLIFVLTRKQSGARPVSAASVFAFATIAVIYLALRPLVMDGFLQTNWGPGWHMLRNVAGGFLYQVYPWPVFSFVFHQAMDVGVPSRPLMPELLVVPLLALLLWAGKRAGRFREMALAIGWTVLALAPMSLFRYRFFSPESFTQNRYYYLSSVGSVLLFVLLLAMLWRSKLRVLRFTGVALFIFIGAGHMVRVAGLERKWSAFTNQYRTVVSAVLTGAAEVPDIPNVAVENAPMEFRYLESAIIYHQPGLRVYDFKSDEEIAFIRRPWLRVEFTVEPGALSVVFSKIE